MCRPDCLEFWASQVESPTSRPRIDFSTIVAFLAAALALAACTLTVFLSLLFLQA
jgi:hypothetical protein